MGLNDDLDILRQTPVFAELDDEALRLIAFGAEHVTLRAKQTLYSQGDIANCAYVVVSGKLELWSRSSMKDAHSQGFLEQAALLGEMALISKTDRQFSVKAVEETQLLKIKRDLFHRLIGEYPHIADILKTRFEKNLANLTGGISNVGQSLLNI